MRRLAIAAPGERLRVLCLGAHSDDIEIGAAGTLLGWMDAGVRLEVTWCVASAPGPRRREAQASADALFRDARVRETATLDIECADFRDGFFPYDGAALKEWLEAIAQRSRPDVVFTHRGDDAHQDHREMSRLTWNSFRDHTVLEYEIPKWDGDLGRPNLYVPMSASAMDRKLACLQEHFGTQRGKDWFDPETFRGLARLRGMECRAPERYAEAFYARKLVI